MNYIVMELTDSNNLKHVEDGQGHISVSDYIVMEMNDSNTLEHVDNVLVHVIEVIIKNT